MSVLDVRRIVFLSAHNACRSQLAEAMARHVFGRTIAVQSAGISPTAVSSLAVASLREIGLDASDQTSKPMSKLQCDGVDVVVFLCPEATAADIPRSVQTLRWFYAPPEAADGTDEDKLEQVRRIRDGLFQRMGALARALYTG